MRDSGLGHPMIEDALNPVTYGDRGALAVDVPELSPSVCPQYRGLTSLVVP